MSVPRFFCPAPLPLSTNFELPAAAAHHASRVLRLRVGDKVQIFDGIGNALDATINSITGKHVILGNLQTCMGQHESSLRIVLAQAMCSSEKMDWIVQKATELGVSEIVPVQTQRSVTKLSGARAEKRTEHWRQVAISACEQCGRNDLPQVHAPQSLDSWLLAKNSDQDSKFILLPGGATQLKALAKPHTSVTLVIGPEGGFTSDEANVAQQMGFAPVLLGPRVLRTETAAIAGICALQTLWGDFN
ncbi:MAG: 16S rRNA (uracil(1498)-N(3))-methyltransferase [Gallionellaceae bacterium]